MTWPSSSQLPRPSARLLLESWLEDRELTRRDRLGPYLLSGADAVKRLPDGRSYPVQGSAALCRCGGSMSKPFCDGTHSRIGFSGDKDAGRVPDKREDYAAAPKQG